MDEPVRLTPGRPIKYNSEEEKKTLEESLKEWTDKIAVAEDSLPKIRTKLHDLRNKIAGIQMLKQARSIYEESVLSLTEEIKDLKKNNKGDNNEN